MSVWSTADLTRFSISGEVSFSTDVPCFVKRVGLTIVSGTSGYLLPDECFNIRRVTYKGVRLDPIPHRDLRRIGMSGSQSGKPNSYIYNNLTKQTIQLYPVPIENVAAPVGAALYGTGILTGIIVEYYATCDGSTNVLPDYLSKRLLKTFTLSRAYLMEGKGQNMKAAKYYNEKWQVYKQLYEDLLSELINSPRSLTYNGINSLNTPMARVSDSVFGVSVEDEG